MRCVIHLVGKCLQSHYKKNLPRPIYSKCAAFPQDPHAREILEAPGGSDPSVEGDSAELDSGVR